MNFSSIKQSGLFISILFCLAFISPTDATSGDKKILQLELGGDGPFRIDINTKPDETVCLQDALDEYAHKGIIINDPSIEGLREKCRELIAQQEDNKKFKTRLSLGFIGLAGNKKESNLYGKIEIKQKLDSTIVGGWLDMERNEDINAGSDDRKYEGGIKGDWLLNKKTSFFVIAVGKRNTITNIKSSWDLLSGFGFAILGNDYHGDKVLKYSLAAVTRKEERYGESVVNSVRQSHRLKGRASFADKYRIEGVIWFTRNFEKSEDYDGSARLRLSREPFFMEYLYEYMNQPSDFFKKSDEKLHIGFETIF